MISSDLIKIPTGDQSFYNKSVGEMVSDLYICEDGTVTGTFHHLTDYTGFSGSAAQQKGYFFPFTLVKSGGKMTFKKNGKDSKKGITWEADNVFRVDASETFTVLVDDEEVVTFNFAKATFDPE